MQDKEIVTLHKDEVNENATITFKTLKEQIENENKTYSKLKKQMN